MNLNTYIFILRSQHIFVYSKTLKSKLSTCTKNLGCSILMWEHVVLVDDLDGRFLFCFVFLVRWQFSAQKLCSYVSLFFIYSSQFHVDKLFIKPKGVNLHSIRKKSQIQPEFLLVHLEYQG